MDKTDSDRYTMHTSLLVIITQSEDESKLYRWYNKHTSYTLE